MYDIQVKRINPITQMVELWDMDSKGLTPPSLVSQTPITQVEPQKEAILRQIKGTSLPSIANVQTLQGSAPARPVVSQNLNTVSGSNVSVDTKDVSTNTYQTQENQLEIVFNGTATAKTVMLGDLTGLITQLFNIIVSGTYPEGIQIQSSYFPVPLTTTSELNANGIGINFAKFLSSQKPLITNIKITNRSGQTQPRSTVDVYTMGMPEGGKLVTRPVVSLNKDQFQAGVVDYPFNFVFDGDTKGIVFRIAANESVQAVISYSAIASSANLSA